MNTTEVQNTLPTIRIADLPSLGAALEGGTFAGLITKQDGTHHAVVLLPGTGEDLTWQQAKEWAAKLEGELPTRPVAALLFANVKAKLKPDWHWTSEEYNASCAWLCDFFYGFQSFNLKSCEASAVAVRCIPLTA